MTNKTMENIRLYGISAIAHQLGVSRQTVYNWLHKREVSPVHALDLAQLLGVPASELNPLFKQTQKSRGLSSASLKAGA